MRQQLLLSLLSNPPFSPFFRTRSSILGVFVLFIIKHLHELLTNLSNYNDAAHWRQSAELIGDGHGGAVREPHHGGAAPPAASQGERRPRADVQVKIAIMHTIAS